MRWVTNDISMDEFDKDPMSSMHFRPNKSFEEQIKKYREYRSQYVEGDPMPSETYSVEMLRQQGIVGLYEIE